MRSLILIACLTVSVAAAADEFRYLIPLTGYMLSDDNTYFYADTVVQNLSPRPASVQVTDVYALNGGKPCAGGDPFVVPPHGYSRFCTCSRICSISTLSSTAARVSASS